MGSISCNLNLISSAQAISSSSKPGVKTALPINTDKSNSSTSASPILLPLPPSRSLFPSPLKFLWFGRDNSSASLLKPSDPSPLPASLISEEDPQDPASKVSHLCTCFPNPDAQALKPEVTTLSEIKRLEEAYEVSCQIDLATEPADSINESLPKSLPSTSSSEAQRNWILRFLRLRSLRKASDTELRSSRHNVEPALEITAEEAIQALKVRELTAGAADSEADKDLTNLPNEDEEGVCMLEAKHERVVHDRQSVSMFLQKVSVEQTQVISKLCLLSNLAYIIPDMQSKNLLKEHHLNLVTSSRLQKVQADTKVALEKSARDARQKHNKAEKKKRLKTEEESAGVDRGSRHAQSISANISSSGQFLMYADASPREAAPLDDANLVQVAKRSTTDEEEETNLGETISKPAKEERVDLQGNCPCEWFICDDDTSCLRYLVIQGSESLASWKTNLSFDPVKFEGLGVLVHRGVYEAAQGLYKVVEEELLKHIQKGSHAKLCFTGHSLGGSMATLLAMMLVKRGVVEPSAMEGVVTLGAPCVLCAGERLLTELGLQERQFVNVVMHRDIVPRAFACDYPDHVARLLKRLNGVFRDHPCLNDQRRLYMPVGQVMILQPDNAQSPGHPLLPPSTPGLYLIRHPQHDTLLQKKTTIAIASTNKQQELAAATSALHMEVRNAQRAFFNTPHPLDMLRDPGAYGFEGAISRDHDPRSYTRAINTVLSHEALRRFKSMAAPRRRRPSHTYLYRRLPTLPSSASPLDTCSSFPSPLAKPQLTDQNSSRRIISSSHHAHMGLLFILSTITADLFSSILSWV